jgi:effector-binding domain-containing protein
VTLWLDSAKPFFTFIVTVPNITTEEITFVDIPPLHVLGIRRRGSYQIIPHLLQQIFEFAMRNRVTITGMPMLLLHETSEEEARKQIKKAVLMWK